MSQAKRSTVTPIQLNNDPKLTTATKRDNDDDDILKDIDWVERTPDEILLQLQSSSKDLNLSIIDFLLKWENANEKGTTANNNTNNTTTYNLNEDTIISTFELIDKGVNALTKVENDLRQVDDWIELQVTQLEETKNKLHLIEIESAMYETNFKNLSNIEEIIEFLLKNMSLSNDEENVLNSPQSIFESILSLKDPLKNNKKYMKLLIDVCVKFKKALHFTNHGGGITSSSKNSNATNNDSSVINTNRTEDENYNINNNPNSVINPLLFEQLQSLPILTLQKEYLHDLGVVFCKHLMDILPEFYDELMQHNCMSDSTTYLAGHGQIIKVNKFNFYDVELHCIGYQKVKRNLNMLASINNSSALIGHSQKRKNNNNNNSNNIASVLSALVQKTKNNTILIVSESIAITDYCEAIQPPAVTDANDSANTANTDFITLNKTAQSSSNINNNDNMTIANEGLVKQSRFHHMFTSYLPLFDLLRDFNKFSFFSFLQHYYLELAESRFYTPMCRSLLKEIKACINATKQSNMCTLHSIFNFELSGKSKMPLPVTLHITSQKNKWRTAEYTVSNSFNCSPWVALGMFLAIIMPVLRAEELFLKESLKVKTADAISAAAMRRNKRLSNNNNNNRYNNNEEDEDDDGSEDNDEYSNINTNDDDTDDDDDDDNGEEDDDENSNNSNTKKADAKTDTTMKKQLLLKVNEIMTEMFQYLRKGEKVIKSILYTNASSITSSASYEDNDGIVCIAMLAVLQPYILQHLKDTVVEEILNPTLNVYSWENLSTGGNNNTTSASGGNNSSLGNSKNVSKSTTAAVRSPTLLSRSLSQSLSLSMSLSYDKGNNSNNNSNSNSLGNSKQNDYNLNNKLYGGGAENNNTIFSEHCNLYSINGYIPLLLLSIQRQLIETIYRYVAEQITWINQQKGDPKGGISTITYKLPSLIYQIFSLLGELKMACIDQFIEKLIQTGFDWIHNLSLQNDKYCDVVRIQNYSFLKESFQLINNNNSVLFKGFIEVAETVLRHAEVNYVTWMVEYEFQSIATLSKRLHSISTGFNDEDIALYVKRKDVLDLRREIEGRKFIEGVGRIKSRLEKHFEEHELDLIPPLWQEIVEHIVTTIHRVDIASKYFQIQSTSNNSGGDSDKDPIGAALAYLESVEF